VYVYTASEERIATIAVNGTAEGASEWTLRDTGGKVLRRIERAGPGASWVWREDYVYAGDRLLASEIDSAPRTLHYFHDHLGSPRLVTGNGGMKVAEHTYFPFGAEAPPSVVQTATMPAEYDRLRFTGHERDSSQLDYMHARYYSAGVGRFLSGDPTWESADLGKPQGWNRYSYVLNNPVNLTDPDGKCPYCIDPVELGKATWATGAEFVTTYVLDADSTGASADLPKDPAERAAYLKAAAASGGILTTNVANETLTRRTNNESAKRLGDKAADAEKKIGIHGVSASAATPQPGDAVGSQAARSDVEKVFKVHNTPTKADPLHRTIELPKPVTNKVARLFNWLFKRAL
jgi:RHS repeat-associated protein